MCCGNQRVAARTTRHNMGWDMQAFISSNDQQKDTKINQVLPRLRDWSPGLSGSPLLILATFPLLAGVISSPDHLTPGLPVPLPKGLCPWVATVCR